MGQEEVRREVVGKYKGGGVTLRELESEYGVSASTIHRWVKQAEAVGGIEELERLEVRGELTAKQRASLPADVRQLQKELKEARLYNELLNAMIDIAEDQMGVDIRKKRGAKRQ
ncbi:MAG: helix-turn-helix domain-containing protein [Pyrinomonadaceae bacterium]